IPVRIGVNTGEVVAAREATDDFLVTGDAVNMAARLQQAAEPWQILCGQRTVRAARDGFLFGPLATIVAKGKRAGIVAAPVTGRVAKRRTRLPLIGRDADLAQLELVARRVVTEGRPSLVSIIAPAGTGKTRLLEELIDRLPELAPDAFMAIAQCLPYGQRLTYWPLRAMLFRLVGLGDDASSADARATIRSWLGSRQVGDADRVTELLAATVGVGEQEVTDKAALFGAWRTVIETASREAPLVLVFEDLHWSSDSLLDLVEFVMQPRGDLRALTIVLARPELLDRRPGWGGGRRSYVALALDPLPDHAIASIVRHLLEASPREVVDRVVARAEGNPFFATELVRTLLDRVGSLADPAAVEEALRTLPDTVQGTLLARMDLLGPMERRVLQLGAVLGRSFRARGIETLAPEIAHGIGSSIEGLLDKELVRATGADAYTFRHILIREVAYQTLPRSERARLHAAAARWLESVAEGREDSLAELIAYHYREAATLVSSSEAPDAGDVAAKATAWLMRAGDIAYAAVALTEAKRHFRAALDLASPELRATIHERLGDVGLSGTEAVESYATSLELVRAGGAPDPARELHLIAAQLGVLMRSQGSIARRPSDDQMRTLIAEGDALVPRVTDERIVARFLTARGFLPFWHRTDRDPSEQELEEADASAQRGLEIAKRLGDLRMQSAALDALGSNAEIRGDAVRSRELALRRLAMGESLDLIERIDAAAMATWMSLHVGDIRGAVRLSGSFLPQVLPGQAVSWTLHLVAWRALALLLAGMLDEAVAAGDRMRELWVEADRPSAGYSLRGFEAAHAAAIARRDAGAAERMREVFLAIDRQIVRRYPSRGGFISLVYPQPDPDLMDLAVADTQRLQPEELVRLLSVASDRAITLTTLATNEASLMERLSARRWDRFPLAVAAAERAVGLVRGDAALLASARTTFDRCGAVALAARCLVEAGLLRADRAEVEAGLHELESIGDLDQVERYARRSA
ncbi:MAG TPA: AAA family ATPase, partial [Candidatus Limnocylindria bacterium]|nr:AAA family ATPase [Candidatus Limnocylindria bacterium]